VGGWERMVGTGTHPSQAVSLVPVSRGPAHTEITAKQLLARQGLLLLHRWDHMPHSCCAVRQKGTSHCAWRMAGAKGQPQATKLRHDTWSSNSPSGSGSPWTCRSVHLLPPGAPGWSSTQLPTSVAAASRKRARNEHRRRNPQASPSSSSPPQCC